MIRRITFIHSVFKGGGKAIQTPMVLGMSALLLLLVIPGMQDNPAEPNTHSAQPSVNQSPQPIQRYIAVDACTNTGNLTTTDAIIQQYPTLPDMAKQLLKKMNLEGMKLPPEGASDTNGIVATREGDNIRLLFTNTSDNKIRNIITIKLPAGCLTFSKIDFPLQGSSDDIGLDRLESVPQLHPGNITKVIWQKPEEGTLLIIENQTARMVDNTQNLLDVIRGLKKHSSHLFRILNGPYNECREQISVVSQGVSVSNRYDRLRNIHRALFLLSNIQTLLENIKLANHTILDKEFDVYIGDLRDSLSETSMCCLQLMPQLYWRRISSGTPDTYAVNMTLANYGGRTIGNARFVLRSKSHSRISPSAIAMLGSIGPGQSVKARFHLELTRGDPNDDLSARLVYYFDRSPAVADINPL
jgi:hypothetical protein